MNGLGESGGVEEGRNERGWLLHTQPPTQTRLAMQRRSESSRDKLLTPLVIAHPIQSCLGKRKEKLARHSSYLGLDR